MTGQELCGAAVRAIGVYWLSHGLTYLAAAAAPAEGYTPLLYGVLSGSEMLVGVFLMFKADGMVATLYAKTPDEDHSEGRT